MYSKRQSMWDWYRQMRNGEEICLFCSVNLQTNVFCARLHPCGTPFLYISGCASLAPNDVFHWCITWIQVCGVWFFFSHAESQIGLQRQWHSSQVCTSCAPSLEEGVGVQHVSARQHSPHFRAFLGVLLLVLLSAVWVLPREQEKQLLILPI